MNKCQFLNLLRKVRFMRFSFLFFMHFFISDVNADYVYCQNNALSCSYSQAAQHAFPPIKPLYYALTTDGKLVVAPIGANNSIIFYIVVYSAIFVLIMMSISIVYL